MDTLNETMMLKALEALDGLLKTPVQLIVGGGGAMLLAHHFPLSTADIDAIPKGIEVHELDLLVKQVARDLDIATDWLNPYYTTFTHTLPSDYGARLMNVFSGQCLTVKALGKEDLLVLKCFAHRPKDVSHAKMLIKAGADLHLVETHLEALKKSGIPGTQAAFDFFDEVQE